MKLKTKSKILLGIFSLSGMLSQVGNCSSFLGISGTVKAEDSPSYSFVDRSARTKINYLYSVLKKAEDDTARDIFLRTEGYDSATYLFSLRSPHCQNTLLHLAAEDNNTVVFGYLLRTFGKDHDILKQENIYGETPLHTAVLCEAFDIVKLAVQERAYDIDFNLKNNRGHTLLGLANEMIGYTNRSENSVEILKMLSIARIVNDNRRPMDDAIKFLSPRNINMKVCIKAGYSDSLLTYAVTHGGYGLTRKLIAEGAEKDPEVWGEKANFDIWNDIFMHCAAKGTTDDLEFLLRNNPHKMNFGKSFLDDAVDNGNTDNFAFLLRNTTPEPDDLDAAMLECVEMEDYDCAKMLIGEKGYDINKISDIDGKTMLHNAADEQDMSKLTFLIMIGANPDIRDVKGRLAIDLLEDAKDKKEFKDLCRCLKKASKPPRKRQKPDKDC